MNTNTKRITHYITALISVVVLVCIDQFTKYLAVQHLKDQMPVVLWKNVLELSYLENRGAAFGIFQGKQWPLIIFTVIVLILIIYFYLMRIPAEKHFGLLNGISIYCGDWDGLR